MGAAQEVFKEFQFLKLLIESLSFVVRIEIQTEMPIVEIKQCQQI